MLISPHIKTISRMNPFFKLRSFFLRSLACCLLPLAAAAQTDSFKVDYSLFRFPDIDRKALDVTGGLAASAFNSAPLQGSVSSSNADFSQTLALRYSRFVNRDNLQANESIFFSPAYSSSRQKSTSPGFSSEERSYAFLPTVFAETERRNYFKPNRYIGLDGLILASYQESKITNTALGIDDLNQQFTYQVSGAVRYGVGRIEPIDDVFLARFMADDMRANGILNEDLTQDELFELGRIMADARNRRIFDFRRQRIFELTQLSNWFAAKGLDNKDQTLFFTTLADNWLYSFYNTRSSGRRFSIGLAPEYFARHDKENGFLPSQIFDLFFEAEYLRTRPVNQFWQWDYRIAFRAGLTHTERPMPLFNKPNSIFFNELSASASVGWYPSSRTFLQTRAELRPTYAFSLDALPSAAAPSDAFVIQPVLSLNGSYFLDYRTRISFNLNTDYRYSTSTLLDPFVSSFSDARQSAFQITGNVRLNYSLF